MTTNKILDIEVDGRSKKQILENIKKYVISPKGFFHVVSLNPENLVLCTKDPVFKEIVRSAQVKIADGIGIVIASKILSVKEVERVTGVGLMEELVSMAGEGSLAVMLIGAKDNLALRLANCYNQKYGQKSFFGMRGIEDIKNPRKEEEDKIFSIVSSIRPRIIFVAFGSPYQEKWLWRNRALLQGIVCIGVGGAFNYLGGDVQRPPKIVRMLGFEWLFRLLQQPWRWKRQLRLLEFMWLIIKQKFSFS